MHTDITLDILSEVTASLGRELREFEEKTCSAFQTRELERERAARQRRQDKTSNRQQNNTMRSNCTTGTSARIPKRLNLKTYTYHALGDYVWTIRRYGTTDSYTTQTVRYFGSTFS